MPLGWETNAKYTVESESLRGEIPVHPTLCMKHCRLFQQDLRLLETRTHSSILAIFRMLQPQAFRSLTLDLVSNDYLCIVLCVHVCECIELVLHIYIIYLQ